MADDSGTISVDLGRRFERIITGHKIRCAEPRTEAERLTKELNMPPAKGEGAEEKDGGR